jgi:hypothetical protein
LRVRAGFKSRVAISADGSRIAVSLRERIEVFAYPGFRPVERFDALNIEHVLQRDNVDGWTVYTLRKILRL